MDDRVGQQLGNYRLLRLLGRGGQAEVYLGEHFYLKSHAALKVLHGVLKDEDVENFVKEAQVLVHLAHPHIVRLLDFAVEAGMPFLVMEYAPHGTLRHRHPTGTRLPLNTIVSYVQQVASALQYIHDQKLMHRDVKPENMLLGKNAEILISDFGLALLARHTRYLSTQVIDQSIAGTVPYLAPEQLQGKPQRASDQYALGIVVYEWLCGTPPFRGSPIEVAMQHLSMPPPSLFEQVPDLPPAIERIVLRTLLKEPKDRFANVQEFALALEQASQEVAPYSFPISSTQENPSLSSQRQPGISDSTPQPQPIWKVPTVFTSLIGREQEIAAVFTLLKQPDVRLLTLLGIGGIGKTRLSIQIALEMRADFADGVCFVPLAAISDPTRVMAAIAEMLDIQEIGSQPIIEQLKVALRNKQFLLLLDNFEQVEMAAPQLEELLAACPSLKMLVTSREVLHLQVERGFPVSPLSLPDLVTVPESGLYSQSAAVALFVQRVQAMLPTFQLTATNARAVAEICVRLDGLPLAIELAAARVKLLPPQALLARLSQRFQILTGGARTLPERQQTLHNTIAWSYNLLNAQEQRLFRRLSVFVGGYTLEAVEAVYSTPGDTATYALEGVASLIDKSLLRQTEQEGREPRLMMLETIREYALEALVASGEMESTRRAHALYYLRLVEDAEKEVEGSQQAVWFDRLEREHDNLREALQWSLEQAGNVEAMEGERSMKIALRLGGALRSYWRVQGHISEGRNFLERALAASRGVEANVRAKALIAAANLAYIQSDYGGVEALCKESLTLYHELGDQAGITHSVYLLGNAAWARGDTSTARSLLVDSLTLARAINDEEYIAWTLFVQGLLESSQGDYARARVLFEESLAKHRGLQNKRGIAHTLSQLAQVLFVSQSDQARLPALLEESLALSKEIGFKEGIASSSWLLGQIAFGQGNFVTARSLSEKSVLLYKEMGHQHGTAESLLALGKIVVAQGDYATARKLYEESLTLSNELGEKWVITACLLELGEVVAALRQFVWATQLWGAAEALREAVGIPIPPVQRADYERSVATTRTHLGEQAFATAWTEGRSMTPEQALAAKGQMPVTAPTPTKTVTSTTSPAGLTAREIEVLRLVARGLTNAQIAQELVLSEKTVATHLTHIFNKTNSDNRAAAVAFLIHHGLV